MENKFYRMKHECKEMPCEIDFCQLDFASKSQFEFTEYVNETGLFTTVIYGFKYCPYCGVKVVE